MGVPYLIYICRLVQQAGRRNKGNGLCLDTEHYASLEHGLDIVLWKYNHAKKECMEMLCSKGCESLTHDCFRVHNG